MNIKELKTDLRQLKKTIHIIDALTESKARYLKRIEVLSSFAQTEKIKEQIETTKKVMSLMKLDEYIKEANEIEAKYAKALNMLDSTERAIIIEAFINGKPYWKIGNDFGYSEDSIRKKTDKILRKMVLYFNKQL